MEYLLSLNIWTALWVYFLRDKLIKDFELEKTLPLDPLSILGQLEDINSRKPIDYNGKIQEVSKVLTVLLGKKPTDKSGYDLK